MLHYFETSNACELHASHACIAVWPYNAIVYQSCLDLVGPPFLVNYCKLRARVVAEYMLQNAVELECFVLSGFRSHFTMFYDSIDWTHGIHEIVQCWHHIQKVYWTHLAECLVYCRISNQCVTSFLALNNVLTLFREHQLQKPPCKIVLINFGNFSIKHFNFYCQLEKT